MKTLLIISSIVVIFLTNTAKANNELQKKITTSNNISLTKIDDNTIQINTLLNIGSMETIIIERSYNNKNYQEVAMLMGNESKTPMQSISLKNKVKTNAKKVFYRVVKMNKDNTGTVIANSTMKMN